jgi:hypothetical protein
MLCGIAYRNLLKKKYQNVRWSGLVFGGLPGLMLDKCCGRV